MIPLLSKKGYQNEIVTLDNPNSEFIKESENNVIPLGPGLFSYGYSSRFSRWLCENVDNYDAVIVRGIWQYHSYAAWRVLRNSNVPYFVYTHGMLDPWFKYQYKFKHIKKLLYWPWAEYKVLRDAAAVLFTTEEEKILARESFKYYSCNEEVVRYGTSGMPEYNNKQLSTIYKEYPQLKDMRYILYMGRIHEKKGCDLLIKAVAKLDIMRDIYLVIAGPDNHGMKENLEKIIESTGVPLKVIWTGMVSSEMKWSTIYNAEAFILPSHQENFGIVVAEALSCGTPVLISNKVNIWREILKHESGLVEEDDLNGTKNLLERWIKMPIKDKEMMKKNTQKCFVKEFHISAAVNSLIEVLNKHAVKMNNGSSQA
jgi:glycosyltransferase involved in cell wall biosynthesis